MDFDKDNVQATKLLKAHIKRLEDIENERSASVNSHSKGLIIDEKS